MRCDAQGWINAVVTLSGHGQYGGHCPAAPEGDGDGPAGPDAAANGIGAGPQNGAAATASNGAGGGADGLHAAQEQLAPRSNGGVALVPAGGAVQAYSAGGRGDAAVEDAAQHAVPVLVAAGSGLREEEEEAEGVRAGRGPAASWSVHAPVIGRDGVRMRGGVLLPWQRAERPHPPQQQQDLHSLSS